MLDLAWGVTPNSRLGCQILLTDGLDGMEFNLPSETVNHSGRLSRRHDLARHRQAARRHPRRGRHVGRRRQRGDRGPRRRGGLRRGRGDAPALRRRRGVGAQGSVLRGAGHLRRAPGRRCDRHPALRARLPHPVPRERDRALRGLIRRRRDADPLRDLQPDGQVPRPDGARARPGRRCAGDRPLCAPPARAGRAGAAPRRRCRPRPELFPLSRPRAISSTICVSRSAE